MYHKRSLARNIDKQIRQLEIAVEMSTEETLHMQLEPAARVEQCCDAAEHNYLNQPCRSRVDEQPAN
jgi:hypothetical protein